MNDEAPPLLSRVADSVYWMARYIERAESTARYIGVNLNLQIDMPLDPEHQWQPLIDTTGDTHLFKERYGKATQDNVIMFLANDPDNPNSILSCLRSARENARSVRETITSEMWAQINSMYLNLQEQHLDPHESQLRETFRNVRLGCHMFHGVTDATMSHNEAWHFWDVGRMMERADNTSRVLDVKYFMLLPSLRDIGTPVDDIHWAAVLRSVSAFQMYRAKYGQLGPKDIASFLVLDDEFPRSVRFCLNCAADSLHAITGTARGYFRFPSEQLLGQLQSELGYTTVEDIMRNGLHEYLDALQIKIAKITEKLNESFFGRAPVVINQTQTQGANA